MGITMGAHRFFTHRSYKAKLWVKVALLLFHTMAGQNCLYIWVRDHRQHHKYSDTDADPHNATRGFFFSHCGWLMSKKHPKVSFSMETYIEKIWINSIVSFRSKNMDQRSTCPTWKMMFGLCFRKSEYKPQIYNVNFSMHCCWVISGIA